ncbi:MAG: sugar ABC transporter permease [Limnochordaceae bacterium]|nr:sugar ABC transporter permease [Limnochordaceae bacterium]
MFAHETVWGWALSLPAVALVVVFSLAPMAYAVYTSFFRHDMLTPPVFVGAANYRALLTDARFINSLKVTAVYVAGTVMPVWLASFGLALLVYRSGRMAGLWRTILFLPTVLPLVSVALVWKLFFHFNGPLNALLADAGFEPIPWLSSAKYAPWAMIIMSWWHATGYYMVIFLAGLLAIPGTLYEAVAIDGGGAWARLRHVTLPLMRPVFALVLVLSIVNGIKTFVFQYVVTGGGPGTATQVITLLIYQTAFSFLRMGSAAAISVVLFVAVLILSLIQLRLLRSEV